MKKISKKQSKHIKGFSFLAQGFQSRIKPNKIKTKKFFEKANKVFRQMEIKTITNEKDNLSKNLRDMIVTDDSFVKQCVNSSYRDIIGILKDMTNDRNLEKEIYNKSPSMYSYIIEPVDDKNLSKKQRKTLNFLKNNMEDIIVNKADVLGVVENCIITYVVSKLHKYFKDKKDEICKTEDHLGLVEPPKNIINSYKYIGKEMSNLFFNNLKKSFKSRGKLCSIPLTSPKNIKGKNKRLGIKMKYKEK